MWPAQELGLPERADVPLLGFIGRLDYQKGVDLIKENFHWLMDEGAQLVLLGSGRHDLESALKCAPWPVPGMTAAQHEAWALKTCMPSDMEHFSSPSRRGISKRAPGQGCCTGLHNRAVAT